MASPSNLVTTPPKEKVVLTLDVELRGYSPTEHGILSIGFCLGRTDRFEVIETGRISLLPLTSEDGKKKQLYEERCLKDFWSRYPEIKKNLEEESQCVCGGMLAFRKKLREYEAKYDVCIASDHPSVDIGCINTYLDIYNFPPLWYEMPPENWKEDKDYSLRYRPIFDTDSYAKGIARQDVNTEYISEDEVAGKLGFTFEERGVVHYPDEDARRCYEFYIKCMLAARMPTLSKS